MPKRPAPTRAWGPANLGNNDLRSIAFAMTLAANSRGFTAELTQIIQLRTAHSAKLGHFDLIDARAVDRENTLHADAAGRDLAHGQGLFETGTAASKANAFENLNTLFGAFTNAEVNADRIARAKFRDIVTKLLLFNFINQVHNGSPPMRRYVNSLNFNSQTFAMAFRRKCAANRLHFRL